MGTAAVEKLKWKATKLRPDIFSAEAVLKEIKG